eukprot:scaffold37575_cov25-Phaeocystis_antarctica.AAC.1
MSLLTKCRSTYYEHSPGAALLTMSILTRFLTQQAPLATYYEPTQQAPLATYYEPTQQAPLATYYEPTQQAPLATMIIRGPHPHPNQ